MNFKEPPREVKVRRRREGFAARKARLVARALAAAERQDLARRQALLMLLDWPDGMPPLPGLGITIGTLVSLESRGLAAQSGRDLLGDRRFVLTDAGRESLAAEGVAA